MSENTSLQDHIDAALRPLQERLAHLEQASQHNTLVTPPALTDAASNRRAFLKFAGVTTLATAVAGATLATSNRSAQASSVGPTAVVFLATPQRVYDSHAHAPLQPNQNLTIALDASLIAATALGVFGTITVNKAKGNGSLTLYGFETPLPATNTISYTTGQTIANGFMVRTQEDVGKGSAAFIVHCFGHATDIFVDIQGYFVATA